MGLFGKPDPEKLKAKGDAEATQRFLHETFGLTRIPGAGYQVQGAVDMTQEVRNPAGAVELVKGTQKLKRFKLVCVLPAQYTTVIVFGSRKWTPLSIQPFSGLRCKGFPFPSSIRSPAGQSSGGLPISSGAEVDLGRRFSAV